MFEKILNIGKNFNKTKLLGNLFTQKLLGRLDVNVFWFKKLPKINGFIENDPVKCLFMVISFFLFLCIATITDKYLSQTNGLIIGTVLIFFFIPLDKIVIRPELFLPALFFKKILKNFFFFRKFIKKLLFLNLWVDVVGLWVLVKI